MERAFLEEQCGESSDRINIAHFDEMLPSQVRTNMLSNNVTTRTKNSFTSYYALPTRHGLLWLSEASQNVAVDHV